MTPSAGDPPDGQPAKTDPEESASRPFSAELEDWLRSDSTKTVGSLGETFGEKSFAVSILLLMFIPALPLPTGGVSHVFEVISALLALQMIAGRTTIWLPRRLQERELGGLTTEKAIPLVSRWIRRLERFSRPRGTHLLERRPIQALIGLSLLATAVTALLSPPFSGLDTIPGVSAVVICAGVLLGDVVLVLVGVTVEVVGVVVIVTIGAAATHWIRHLF